MSKERIYLTELSKYLGHDHRVVKKFAKRQGLVRKVSLGTAYAGAEYVSPYGAQRIIAYIRAIQGDAYMHGKQFHEFALHERERMKRAGGRSPRKLLPSGGPGQKMSASGSARETSESPETAVVSPLRAEH